jgi:ABC-2 type transport system permease protein
MNAAFKKLRAWLAGPRSDFWLFLAVLALANLLGAKAFFRLDLTANRSYSLSEASRRAVKTLEEPLSVKVFFTGGLPAPYNSVERYLGDLLIEYRSVDGRRFSYDFFDMESDGNKDLAESYGIRPVQIQEVKNDEVGFRNAYMGLAIVYGDAIEPVNDITSAAGLEYRLTTTMEKLKSTASALSGLSGKVKVTLYASSSLKAFRIQGFGDLDRVVRGAFDRVNAKNRGKLEYAFADPASPEERDALSARYGLQKINWGAQPGLEAGSGILGIALEHGDRVRTIPIGLARGLLGGYGLTGLDALEQRLGEGLQALMSQSPAIGYLTGHGERALYDQREGAGNLIPLVQDLYEFKELDLSKEDIPADLTTVVVNGPRSKYGEAELYKLDQFLMRGGSLLALLDPFEERLPQGSALYGGGMPEYVPIDTGLEALLERYGAKPVRNYVLDAECFVSRQPGMGETPLYYAPIIGKKGMNRSAAISRGLAEVLFYKPGEVSIVAPASADRTATPLAASSAESWLVSERISLLPYALSKPAADKLAARNLAVLLEGRFESAFPGAPGGSGAARDGLSASTHLAKSVQSGKIVVVGTSEIAGPLILDETGRQPVAVFLRNAIDYLAGNPELIDMRTKGLANNPLDKTPPAARRAAKTFNQYGLPLLVALAGLLAWRLRTRRRAKIQAFYAEGER